MSIGTIIDAGNTFVWRSVSSLFSFLLSTCSLIWIKIRLPLFKLVSCLTLIVTGSHYYCPAYISVESTVRSKFRSLDAGRSYTLLQSNWTDYSDLYASAHKRNKCLVRAVIKVESENCTQLVSSAGALGCMQIMKATARSLGLRNDRETLDLESNIARGESYLFSLIDRLGVMRGLQAYNAGEARIGMTEENRAYPHKVLAAWAQCIDDEVRTGIADHKPEAVLEGDLDNRALQLAMRK